jgi:hypothetical protein
MSLVTVVAAVGIIGYVIWQQVAGAALTGRRVVVLPAVLTVIGIVDLVQSKTHPEATDIVLLVASAAVAIAVGAALGVITRLERRDGSLWAQLPTRGLWLWAALIASRLIVGGVAHASGAHVASGTTAILLTLGLNRIAQAAVIVPRAIAAGIPFAPEKDGRVFGASWFSGSTSGEN